MSYNIASIKAVNEFGKIMPYMGIIGLLLVIIGLILYLKENRKENRKELLKE